MIGGAFGIIALFAPWVIKNGTDRYSINDILTGPTGIGLSLDFLLPLLAVVFLMGAVAVFISPYGAAAQLGGASIALFIVNIASMGNSETHTIVTGRAWLAGCHSRSVRIN
jgi:hypothetical protein